MTARGIRLNNPGNIRLSDIKWQGKVTPSSDQDFETFKDPTWGIRALVKVLLTDGSKGINTVHSIISRYAPSSENNTQAYEEAVCKHLSVTPDQVLDMDDYTTIYALVGAIILHENVSIPYSDAVINKGINMAGVYNVPPVPMAKQPEAHAATGAAAIAAISVVGSSVQNIAPAIPLIQQILTVAPWVITVIAVVGATYMGYVLYKRNKTGV